ncbi:hypothetical protein K2W90_00235 [Candidatus Babeliales bacterium]|nr:hypothetical protein [Candidatus Babeliales bacterium]
MKKTICLLLSIVVSGNLFAGSKKPKKSGSFIARFRRAKTLAKSTVGSSRNQRMLAASGSVMSLSHGGSFPVQEIPLQRYYFPTRSAPDLPVTSELPKENKLPWHWVCDCKSESDKEHYGAKCRSRRFLAQWCNKTLFLDCEHYVCIGCLWANWIRYGVFFCLCCREYLSKKNLSGLLHHPSCIDIKLHGGLQAVRILAGLNESIKELRDDVQE